MDQKRIILIGGAPTTGKSTLAEQLARHLALPWISTDQIRTIMRKTTNRADHPKLFGPEGYSVERFLTEFSAEQIVQRELEQGEAVWTSACPFIKQEWTWSRGFIVEGVNILPHLVARDFSDQQQVRAAFLIDNDVDRIRRVIFARGLAGDAHSYSDGVKDKEVEWVTLFSRRIKADASRFGFPVIEVQKNGSDLDAVLAAIKP